MTSRKEAPDGAFSVGAQKPAMEVQLQDSPDRSDIDLGFGSPVRIQRMIREIFDREKDVKSWQDKANAPGRRFTSVGGEFKWVPVRQLVAESITEAQHRRDEHIAELRQAIDYHLTEVAYVSITCPECRLPADPLEFAAALAAFEKPAMQCATCLGVGFTRSPKTDEKSISDAKRVTYWSSVLDDFIRCCKIKAGAADADQAYMELETANRNLLIKFGNENQTALEGDDALQGVRHGLVDAAIRFDPTRKEGAQFATVAYNWCRRNSRARQNGQKRAGVYAPSIEQLGTDEEGNGAAAMIQSAEGALGSFDAPTCASPYMALDLREKVAGLPELQRSVVQYELAGMSTGEVATALDITRVKVRKIREQAFESLRSSMTGYASVRALND